MESADNIIDHARDQARPMAYLAATYAEHLDQDSPQKQKPRRLFSLDNSKNEYKNTF